METFLEGYKEGVNVYQTFDMPHLFNEYTIYGRYVHKEIWEAWFSFGGYKSRITSALFTTPIYNDTTVFEMFPDLEWHWENQNIYLQVRLVIYTLIATAILALFIVYKLLSCICCPSSKGAAKVKTN